MTAASTEPRNQTQLRVHAEGRLKGGTAPSSRGWATGAQALGLLYRLASHGESAADALKLLHELQVHQVELDLQQEQWEDGRRDLSEDLARYRALYDFAPLAYLTADLEGRITEANLAGAELLRAGANEVVGRRVEAFLSAPGRQGFAAVLERLKSGEASASCDVQSAAQEGTTRRWRIVAKLAPGQRSVLVAIIDEPERAESDPAS